MTGMEMNMRTIDDITMDAEDVRSLRDELVRDIENRETIKEMRARVAGYNARLRELRDEAMEALGFDPTATPTDAAGEPVGLAVDPQDGGAE